MQSQKLFINFIISLVLFSSISLAKNNNAQNHHTPVARAGASQYAQTLSHITLNASNSTDADGDKISYQWKIIQKPTGSITQLDDENKIVISKDTLFILVFPTNFD